MSERDNAELVTTALRRAFDLGQTYWMLADSDSYSQNRRSNETRAKFKQLVNDTLEALK